MTSVQGAPAGKRGYSSTSPTASSSASKRSKQEAQPSIDHAHLAHAIDPSLDNLDTSSALPISVPWNAYAQPSWPAGERSESAIRSTETGDGEQQTAAAVASYFVNMPFTQSQGPSFTNAQMLYGMNGGQQQQQQQQQESPTQQQGSEQPQQQIEEPQQQMESLGSPQHAAPSHLDQFTIHIATSLAQTYADTLASQSRLLEGIAALQERLAASSAHSAAAGVGTSLGDEECLSRLNVLSSQIGKMNRRVISSLKGLYTVGGAPVTTTASTTTNSGTGNGVTIAETQMGMPADVLPEVLGQTTFAELEALPSASTSSIPYTVPPDSSTPARSKSSPKRSQPHSNSSAPIIPAAATPQAAVVQWLSGDPAAGLTVPLKDWPHAWRRGNQIYCQRRTIYRGWEMSGKDWVVFTGLYGTKVSMAAKAITQARIQTGEIKTRQRRRAGEGTASGEGGEAGTE